MMNQNIFMKSAILTAFIVLFLGTVVSIIA